MYVCNSIFVKNQPLLLSSLSQAADSLEELFPQSLVGYVGIHGVDLGPILFGGALAESVYQSRDAGILLAHSIEVVVVGGVSRRCGGGSGGGSGGGLLRPQSGLVVIAGRSAAAVALVEDAGHGGIFPTPDGGLGAAALADKHAGLGDGDGVVEAIAPLAVLLVEDGVDDVELDVPAGGDRVASSHVFDSPAGDVAAKENRFAVRSELSLFRHQLAHVPDALEDGSLRIFDVLRRNPRAGVFRRGQLPAADGKLDPDARSEGNASMRGRWG